MLVSSVVWLQSFHRIHKFHRCRGFIGFMVSQVSWFQKVSLNFTGLIGFKGFTGFMVSQVSWFHRFHGFIAFINSLVLWIHTDRLHGFIWFHRLCGFIFPGFKGFLVTQDSWFHRFPGFLHVSLKQRYMNYPERCWTTVTVTIVCKNI